MKTPVSEFKWPSCDDIGPAFLLTCRNHPELQWSTKHPTHRNLHYLGLADGVEVTKENAKYMWQECPCEWDDLLVIEKETE